MLLLNLTSKKLRLLGVAVLQLIKEANPEIASDCCNGKGIGLLNLDGQIAEYIIKKFTYSNIPVLCIHDSFIVSIKHDGLLRTTMHEAVKHVIANAHPGIKRIGLGYSEIHSYRHLDRDLYLDRMKSLGNSATHKTTGYLYRKQIFEEYLGSINN